MSKSTLTHLLLPGESAWEFWTLSASNEATLTSSHSVERASEIEKIPQGDLIFLFPVKAYTSLPLQVPTNDASLFEDLAATHAERIGIRTDPFAGQLNDIFPISESAEHSVFLSVILRNPQPEELPNKSPKAFDISPRSFEVEGNTLSLWRELGQWVFAFHQQGKLIYSQATSVIAPSPDSDLLREIRIALIQLTMQSIPIAPEKAIIWSSDPNLSTAFLAETLSIKAEVSPRPAPSVPHKISKLLPDDVRAARKQARKRRQIQIAVAAMLCLYLAGIAYLSYDLWKVRSNTNKILSQANALAPQSETYAKHIAKWDELAHCIDATHNTIDILNRIARCVPPNSGLRLRTADISATEIKLQGEAPQLQAVNQFSLNLKRNNELLAFQWQTPEPKQSSRGWELTFNGAVESATP